MGSCLILAKIADPSDKSMTSHCDRLAKKLGTRFDAHIFVPKVDLARQNDLDYACVNVRNNFAYCIQVPFYRKITSIRNISICAYIPHRERAYPGIYKT